MGAREGYDPAFEDGAASEGWSLDAQCHVLACEKWSRMREDLPERYGSWKTVYSRFCKWRDDSTLLRIFQSLNEDADMETLSLDFTFIKAHPHSAGTKKGL